MLHVKLNPWLEGEDDSCEEFCAPQAAPAFSVASRRSLLSLLQYSVSSMLPGSHWVVPLSPSRSVAACWVEVGHSTLQAITQTDRHVLLLHQGLLFVLSKAD